jgi:hypothetical protein
LYDNTYIFVYPKVPLPYIQGTTILMEIAGNSVVHKAVDNPTAHKVGATRLHAVSVVGAEAQSVEAANSL